MRAVCSGTLLQTSVLARLTLTGEERALLRNTELLASGPSALNKDQIAERGARMARRDDREYREYLREEQRSQPGCPAREVVLDQRGRATQRAELSSAHTTVPIGTGAGRATVRRSVQNRLRRAANGLL